MHPPIIINVIKLNYDKILNDITYLNLILQYSNYWRRFKLNFIITIQYFNSNFGKIYKILTIPLISNYLFLNYLTPAIVLTINL